VLEVDSGLPPNLPTPTDGQDIPDGDSQPLLGIEEDSQSWGDTESQTQSAPGSMRPVRTRRITVLFYCQVVVGGWGF